MTPTDDREFERGYFLGPRTCDTCHEWLPDTYLSVDEVNETLVPGDDGEFGTRARRSVELKKFCDMDCAHDGVMAFLSEHHLTFEDEGPGLEPVTACGKCGIPVLRLVEHSTISLLEIKPEHRVTFEQVICVLCAECGGFYGDDDGDDDPDDGLPLIEPRVPLAA